MQVDPLDNGPKVVERRTKPSPLEELYKTPEFQREWLNQRLDDLRQECGKFGCITDKKDVLWLLDKIEALIRREEGREPKIDESKDWACGHCSAFLTTQFMVKANDLNPDYCSRCGTRLKWPENQENR